MEELPRNEDLEVILLKIIISSDTKYVDTVLPLLPAGIFHNNFHSAVHRALVLMREANIVVNPEILVDFMVNNNKMKLGYKDVDIKYGIMRILQHEHHKDIRVDDVLSRLYEYKAKRDIIRVSKAMLNDLESGGMDSYTIIKKALQMLESIRSPAASSVDLKSALKDTILNIEDYQKGEKISIYKTGNKLTDEIIQYSSCLMMVAGASGVGKTTWITHQMRTLLMNNDDVSILWVTIDHEDGRSIIRKMISQDLLISDSTILSRDGKITQEMLDMIIATTEKYSDYDIEFMEHPCYVGEIAKTYASFCKERPNRLNVLVVDNIMRLKDLRSIPGKSRLEIEDDISNDFKDLYKSLSSFNPMIILLHHFTKDQTGSNNVSTGYRPTKEHLKGSSRWDDNVQKVILLNRPGNYLDMLAEYEGDEDIISQLFITEIIKNTSGKTGIIRWFCLPQFNLYKEIEENE